MILASGTELSHELKHIPTRDAGLLTPYTREPGEGRAPTPVRRILAIYLPSRTY